MKSYNEFIIADLISEAQINIPKDAPKSKIVSFKRIIQKFRQKTGRNISQAEFDKLLKQRDLPSSDVKANLQGRLDAEKGMGPSSFDTEDPTNVKEPENKSKTKLDDTTSTRGKLKKSSRPSITAGYKKRPFGNVTGLDPQTGTAKYVPPKDVPKSELKGPNVKGEIVNRRRAKRARSNAPSYADVKAKIDAKEPKVVRQAEVSDEIENKQETKRSKKLKKVGKPTPTTPSTSNNYKRNPNPTPRKTDQQVMRDLETRSSSSNRKQGYSIKNDLEAIKRKRNISSNTSSSSSSSNNKPPEIETPLRDNQKKSFKKFKSRIDSIGIDPSIEKTKTKFDKILDSSKKKEFFDKTKYNNQNQNQNQQNKKDDKKGGKKDKNNKNNKNNNKNNKNNNKNNKKTTWQKLRKNLFGKSKKYKGDAVSNLLYPGFTGVSAYMRERGKGSGQTRSTAVGVGRGYLDYKAARLAGQTAFKVTPGPAWLKGASATVASGLALVGSSKLGRNIEDNLPLNKVQQAQVDAAKDKEEKKKQIMRLNQLRSIITPPRASLPNVPSKSQGIDFGYGFNTKGSGKSR